MWRDVAIALLYNAIIALCIALPKGDMHSPFTKSAIFLILFEFFIIAPCYIKLNVRRETYETIH